MRFWCAYGRRLRVWVGFAVAAGIMAIGVGPQATPTVVTSEAASTLPACPFWTTVTPPVRSISSWVPPLQVAPPYDLSGKAAPPTFVSGQLSGGQVSITFDAVPGANSYRVDKNSQPLGWISDTGQATYTAVDPMPCAKAFYTLVAMFTPSASVISQMSEPLQLQDSGQVTPWQNPVGSSMQMMITSYNDPGLTSVGYQTELGICAVDPRVIPWGTYFYVPGYGTCYSADIGTWIQGDIVDVWLPGTQASGWGVQSRSITYLARPTSPTPTPSPVTPPSAPSGITLTPNGGGQATLTWIAPTDNGGAPVTYYAIYLYPQMATPVVVTANPNSYSISGLNPNTYYVGTVTAYNGAGWSPWGGWSSWSFVT